MEFCNAGVGRSPSIVIGYLCCLLNHGFGQSVQLVSRRKSDISILPNLIKTIEEVRTHSRKQHAGCQIAMGIASNSLATRHDLGLPD